MNQQPASPNGEDSKPKTAVGSRGLGGVFMAVLTRRKTLAAVAVLAVFVFSSIPFDHRLGFHRFDKEFHLMEYLVVGLLLFNLLTKGFREVTVVALLSGFAFLAVIGVIDEFYQYWIPGRTPDRSDFFFSALGAALAAAITGAMGFWFSRSGRKGGLTDP